MRDTQIASMECYTVSVPLSGVVRLGDVEVRTREFVFIRVVTADGVQGAAYAMTRGAPVAQVVADLVWPNIAGMDAINIARVRERLDRALVTQGAAGMAQRATSLLDLALWDAKGKFCGLPVWQLLGGGTASTPPVMVIADYKRAEESYEAYGLRLAAYGGKGFTALKIYPPADLAELPAMVRAIRDVFSRQPETAALDLVLDMAWMWRTSVEALKHVRQWDDLNLAWIEDPMPADRIVALRELTRATVTPIAAGDELSVPSVASALISTHSVDLLRLDCTTIGGITTAAEVLYSARAAGIPVSTHAYPDFHRHLGIAFSDVVVMVERFPESSPYWGIEQFVTASESLLPSTTVGALKAPEAPGLDIEIDWDRVKAHAIAQYHRSIDR